jgi:hypothetical protein
MVVGVGAGGGGGGVVIYYYYYYFLKSRQFSCFSKSVGH